MNLDFECLAVYVFRVAKKPTASGVLRHKDGREVKRTTMENDRNMSDVITDSIELN